MSFCFYKLFFNKLVRLKYRYLNNNEIIHLNLDTFKEIKQCFDFECNYRIFNRTFKRKVRFFFPNRNPYENYFNSSHTSFTITRVKPYLIIFKII